MNIFDLATKYCNSIPSGATDLAVGTRLVLNTFEDGTELAVLYRGYEGTMAEPDSYNTLDKRPYLGYFDLFIESGITHRKLLNDLLIISTLENVERVWHGDEIDIIATDIEEKKILYILGLCMVEQEINWGKNQWQKWTNFPNRPRDMLTGFVHHAFDRGTRTIPYWVDNTPYFGPGRFRNYPVTDRVYFDNLLANNDVPGILTDKILGLFEHKLKDKRLHP